MRYAGVHVYANLRFCTPDQLPTVRCANSTLPGVSKGGYIRCRQFKVAGSCWRSHILRVICIVYYVLVVLLSLMSEAGGCF